MDLKDKGYIVPDPPSPYDSLCVRVYIPNHVFYIGAFWQAYQFFTTWLAWARDPLFKGREAAKLWRSAYDKARTEFDLRKGICEMNITGFRQKPNDPCILQAEFDSNNVWVDVADISKCVSGSGGGVGAMQYDGVNINIYNGCTGEFEPSGEPFDPIQKGIYDSLYSPDTGGACDGAANIAAWLKYCADNSLGIFETAGVAGAAASFILGTLVSTVGGLVLTEALITALGSQFVEEGDLFGDAKIIDISAELSAILLPYMESDGTIREPKFTEAVLALYARRDEEEVDTGERVRWGHEANILSAVGPYVASRQNKYAGITGATCDALTWVEVFDFTDGLPHGWTRTKVNSLFWGLNASDGWRTVEQQSEFGKYNMVMIGVPFAERTVNRIKVDYHSTAGINDEPSGWPRISAWNTSSLSPTGINPAPLATSPASDPSGQVELDYLDTETTGVTIQLGVGSDVDGSTAVGGSGRITKITIFGEGENPFH